MNHAQTLVIEGKTYYMWDCVTTPQARLEAQRLAAKGVDVRRAHHMVYWLKRPEKETP